MYIYVYNMGYLDMYLHMGYLDMYLVYVSVGSLKFYVSFAKEPYERDNILQKRHTILRSLRIVATQYQVDLLT